MDRKNRDRFLAPGTRVCRDYVSDCEANQTEFGIVMHCWKDEHAGFFDCYVAFFGHDGFPTSQPAEKPYILRYASVSLTPV